MIEYKCEISPDLADNLEVFFYEIENNPWMLMQDAGQITYYLCGYFEDEILAQEYYQQLKDHFEILPEKVEKNFIEDRDWQEAYKEFLHPWNDRELHWIPIWKKDTYPLPEGHVAVYFDAGMAFGTGNHETTQLCGQRLLDIKSLLNNDIGEKSVIDAGCGSGILSISAKKLGFAPIMGFDIDPMAIEVSLENAQRNEIVGEIEYKTGGIEENLKGIKTDVLVANIESHILCENADFLIEAIEPKGFLVLSGILAIDVDKVINQFKEKLKNRATVSSKTKGEWADVFIEFS